MTSPKEYTFLGLITLPPGTWADWFAGSMSALAVAVALAGYGFSVWQQRRHDRENERQAIQQIGLKLFTVFNRTDNIRHHVWATYTGPALQGPDADQVWRTVSPLIGLRDNLSLDLTASEVALLMKMKASGFLQDLMLATDRLHSIVSAMSEYQLKYEAMYAMMPPAEAMDGTVAQHSLSTQQYNKLRPYSVALEQMITSVRNLSQENSNACKNLINQFNPLVVGYFGKKVIELEPLPAEEQKS